MSWNFHTRGATPRVRLSLAGLRAGGVLTVVLFLAAACAALCLGGAYGAAGGPDASPGPPLSWARPAPLHPLLEAQTWNIDGEQVGADFGYVVRGAGDVNGDGFSDIIVGAPLFDAAEGNDGRAYVFYGGPSGPSAQPDWVYDGEEVAAELGISVACAGDVNADGYDDVIVGSSHYDGYLTDIGRVYVFHGGEAGLSVTPEWIVEGDITKAHLGFSVDGAGDVNGDGYDDVIIGSFNYRNPDTKEGRAYIYQGGPAGLSPSPAWMAEGNQAYAYFAISVAGAGDVNGDGYDDVIVGASDYDVGPYEDAGRAYVFLGDSTGVSPSPVWIAEGEQTDSWLGRCVDGAGDVNADGYDDVIVGAPGFDNGHSDAGLAYVYHGSPSGPSATAAWTKEGDQLADRLGHSVSGLGDVDGDGYGDVAVGAHGYDNGADDAGKAYIYHGGEGGLSSSHSWSAEGGQTNAEFGFSIDVAGDINDNGQPDVIIGAKGYIVGDAEMGRAFIFQMEPDSIAPTVVVGAPNGGETWYIGNTYDITWIASDASGVDSVEVLYSIDGGNQYVQVASGLLNDGQYSWTVPDTPSDQAIVKVIAYDPGPLAGADSSDWAFSIVADTTGPAVSVLVPNGSETWYVGSDYEISWTAWDETGVDSVSIYYSIDNGKNYSLIASGEPNDSSYVWTVPDEPTHKALVKVVAFDSRLNEGDDSSDGMFDIDRDTQPPEVTVVSPNGGESWLVGSPRTISWIATDGNSIDSVSIYYSVDGGDAFTLISSGEPNDSSYVWRIPPELSDSSLVEIVAYDGAGNPGGDRSDEFFEIVPDTIGPEVVVTAPDGGEMWETGGFSVITWTASDPAGVDSVNIYYSIDGGGSFELISSGEANDSTYIWEVPATPSDSALIKVIAYDPSLNGGQDVSDSLFVITSDIVDVPAAPSGPPNGLLLWGNSPNPFVTRTEIAFYLPADEVVRLHVYDAAGRLVARLVDGVRMDAGIHRVPWNGRSDDGDPRASGVYFYTLRAAGEIETRKMVLAR